MFDAQWDPQGCGIYAGFSDETAVFWDGLWTNTSGVSTTLPMYSHHLLHGGIWRILPFQIDSQSAVVSVSSDGTVRCHITSCSPSFIQLFSKKQLNAEAKSYQKHIVYQPFHMRTVGNNNNNNNTVADIYRSSDIRLDSIEQDQNENQIQKNEESITTDIYVSTTNRCGATSSHVIDIAQHQVSLCALDTCILSLSLSTKPLSIQGQCQSGVGNKKDTHKQRSITTPLDTHTSTGTTTRLLAYGGSTGLLRVHSLNLTKAIFGSKSL